MSNTVETFVKKPVTTVFRRALIKRRSATTGLFESSWQDISRDVKSYGKIANKVDDARRNKFTFGNLRLVMQNNTGSYNPHDDQASLWYGYLNQQRTLVKIQAGFVHASMTSNGVLIREEFPSETLWDVNRWDMDSTLWDADDTTQFKGIISGDISLSDSNEVSFLVKPLVSVFQDFPAKNLVGWSAGGVTASQFVGMVRDMTDGSGSYVFRPFFDDTTSNWDISTTSTVFSNLNTSGAEGVVDATVWEVIEKLAEAENFVPYITKSGVFKFISRSSVDTTSAFDFHGAGSFNTFYGQTIKRIESYGFRASKYYSRVQIKWNSADTSTSYEVYESTLTVAAGSNPWVLGAKTLEIENYYIPSAAIAATLASQIFTEVSSLKKEIAFETSFVPHLDLFDRIAIYYDVGTFNQNNLWDQNDWAADATSSSTDLVWDAGGGDAIAINGSEFKFLSFEIDLDNLQNKFIAREL